MHEAILVGFFQFLYVQEHHFLGNLSNLSKKSLVFDIIELDDVIVLIELAKPAFCMKTKELL